MSRVRASRKAWGAQIIDINMGCPAREVTGKQSGSALMRDLDHALTLIEATVNAVKVPVTLKMRLGWDNASRNAPELARRAEAAGIQLVTVHARTRCQFFKGTPIGRPSGPSRRPSASLIVNGDIVDPDTARRALALSGADGVMVGARSLRRSLAATEDCDRARHGQRSGRAGLASQARIALAT